MFDTIGGSKEPDFLASLEDLPKEWPEVINTVEIAKRVAEQLKQSEQLTSEHDLGRGPRFRREKVTRTFTGNIGQMIIDAVNRGQVVRLQMVSLRGLKTTGSRGSQDRKGFMIPAITELGKHGPQIVLNEKLPPIILKEASSGLDIKDGHTRAMLAAENGLETIRAYVIPADPATLVVSSNKD